MTIRSNPPGAFVWVDNHPIGVTPVSSSFVYYGKRQFRLVRDGYETLTVDQRVKTPWYEWFGLDFFSENIVPFTIRDEQKFDFQMVPQQVPPREQLTARAEELRASTQASRQLPLGPPAAPPAGAQPLPPPPPPGAVPPGATPYVLPPPSGLPPGGYAPPAGSGTRIPPPGTGEPAYVAPQPNSAPVFGAPGVPSGSMYAPPSGYQPSTAPQGYPVENYPSAAPAAAYPNGAAGVNYPSFPADSNYVPPSGYGAPAQGAPGTMYPGGGAAGSMR